MAFITLNPWALHALMLWCNKCHTMYIPHACDITITYDTNTVVSQLSAPQGCSTITPYFHYPGCLPRILDAFEFPYAKLLCAKLIIIDLDHHYLI